MFISASGKEASLIGQGTWYLGENRVTYQSELSALRAGIDAGMNLLDTAEMYGDGGAEELLGEAIRPYNREDLFVVSKVYPHHAGRRRIFTACKDSLSRLRTDYLDLYLLHWRGSIPLSETVECMEELKQKGLIRSWGVSNLDLSDMNELFSVKNGTNCATDQVLYHLGSRGIEYDLLPEMRRHDIPVMAYCPLAQAGRLRRGLNTLPVLHQIAEGHGVSKEVVLLSFLTYKGGVYPIPRTGKRAHAIENAKALHFRLTEEEYKALDAACPALGYKVPLDIQ